MPSYVQLSNENEWVNEQQNITIENKYENRRPPTVRAAVCQSIIVSDLKYGSQLYLRLFIVPKNLPQTHQNFIYEQQQNPLNFIRQ